MRFIPSYLLAGAVLLGMVSCNSGSDFKKTQSGLLYKIFPGGNGPIAKKGQFLKANVVQKVRDSVLYSSEGGMPAYIQVDSARPIYSPSEVFSLLRKGDSVVCIQLVDSLMRRNGGQLPPFIHKKDKITISFKVLDIFDSKDSVIADREAELEKQKARDIAGVEGYLAKKGIQAQKTEKGTYYVITTPGDGPVADSGKEASILYAGRLMSNDKEFESNMKAPNNTPIKVDVGRGMVIPGWDDALRHFRKGSKGTLYIPSFLAYGGNARPGSPIPPFANLAFDIEVVDVTDAPAQPAQQPGMPQMSMPGGRPMMPGGRPMMPGARPGAPAPAAPTPGH